MQTLPLKIAAEIQRLPLVTCPTKYKGYLWKIAAEIQSLPQIMRTQTLSLPQIYAGADTMVFSYANVI